MNLSRRLKNLEKSSLHSTRFEFAFKKPHQSTDEALETAKKKHPDIKDFIIVSWIPTD